MSQVFTEDERVAIGYDHRKFTINKFGRNIDVDIGSEDIIGIGGTLDLSLLSGAVTTIDIVSGSTDDDLTGSGAEKVIVYGLDANYERQQLEMTLNGTGPVTSTGYNWRFVYRAEVTQSNNGANDTYNAGIITISKTGGSNLMTIAIGDNQTMHAAFMIPAGKVGLLKRHKFAVETDAVTITVTCEMWIKPFDMPWLLKYRLDIKDGQDDDTVYVIPKFIPEKAIIKLRVTSDTVNAVADGIFDLKVVNV